MPAKKIACKIRFNPAKTVKAVNVTLDAIDANGLNVRPADIDLLAG